jgi:sporulation protein YlmC with PRC-barrel domain
MRIVLGSDVYGSDGEYFGHAAGVVVDSGARRVTRLLIGGGPLGDGERMADIALVHSTEADRMSLVVDRAGAESFPVYAKETHVYPDREPEFPVILPASGAGGPVLFDNPQTGMGYPGGDMFDPAPIDPPRMEVVSNLLTAEVMLPKGSDVVSADGHKVGDLDELELSSDASVATVIVRAGFLFHHDLRLDAGDISEFDDGKLHLRVTKDAAESHRA